MFRLVQLEDGNYHLTVDYTTDNGIAVHLEWIFCETESDAKPLDDGICIKLEFKV